MIASEKSTSSTSHRVEEVYSSRIRLVCFLIIILLATPSVSHGRVRFQTLTTEEDFASIITNLEPAAKSFASSTDDKAPAISKIVKRVQYTKDSVPALSKALQGLQGKPLQRLYLTYQLIYPLKMAGNDTLRALVPLLIKIFQEQCIYESMPHWPSGFLNTLTKGKPQERKKALDRKISTERAIVKHNRTVNAVEKTLKYLLVVMDFPQADEALLKRLKLERDKHLATFLQTIDTLKAESVHMKPAQGKRYYEQLQELTRGIEAKKADYFDPTKPKYSKTADSTFEKSKCNFVISTLQLVNIMATVAGEPAVKIPGEKIRTGRIRKLHRRSRR